MSLSVKNISILLVAIIISVIAGGYGGFTVLDVASRITGRVPIGGPALVNTVYWGTTAIIMLATTGLALLVLRRLSPADNHSSIRREETKEESSPNPMFPWEVKAALFIVGALVALILRGFVAIVPVFAITAIAGVGVTQRHGTEIMICSDVLFAFACFYVARRASSIRWQPTKWSLIGCGSAAGVIAAVSLCAPLI